MIAIYSKRITAFLWSPTMHALDGSREVAQAFDTAPGRVIPTGCDLSPSEVEALQLRTDDAADTFARALEVAPEVVP